MKRLIVDALASYRAKRAADAAVHLKAADMAKGTDRHWTALDRARQAFKDCDDAHKELCEAFNWDVTNPDYNACDIMIEMLTKIIGNKAQEAYDRAEAAAEEASIADFHRNAFGE